MVLDIIVQQWKKLPHARAKAVTTNTSHQGRQRDPSSACDPDETWQYELVHYLLTEAPPFNAVSYVWGEDIRGQVLELVGGDVIMINRNLAIAIPFLSPVHKTGYLWVDQLCIDQANTRGRGHQVKQMGQVYSRCEFVLIWLGTEIYQTVGFRRLV